MKKRTRIYLILALACLFVSCKSAEEKMDARILETFSEADKGNDTLLTEHLDSDYLAATGLDRDAFAESLRSFQNEKSGKTVYEIKSKSSVEDGTRYVLKATAADGNVHDLVLIVRPRGDDYTIVPMDITRMYVMERNDKNEYFRMSMSFAAENDEGLICVIEIENRSDKDKYYFMPKTVFTLETEEGTYRILPLEMEFLPKTAKRMTLPVHGAKGRPKKITVTDMADEKRFFQYTVELTEKPKPVKTEESNGKKTKGSAFRFLFGVKIDRKEKRDDGGTRHQAFCERE